MSRTIQNILERFSRRIKYDMIVSAKVSINILLKYSSMGEIQFRSSYSLLESFTIDNSIIKLIGIDVMSIKGF
jgi:hypothetical protein